MAFKKSLPNNQSIEQLLKILKDGESEREIVEDFGNDVVSFLSFYNIKPGDELVQARILYKLYKTWSNNPVSRIGFGNIALQYVDSKPNSSNTGVYYKLNLSAFQVTSKTIEFLKEEVQDRTKVPSWGIHFNSFLNYYKIEPGNFWLETYYLYHLYDLWTFKNKAKSYLGYKQFFNFCSIHFKHKRRTSNRVEWFAVNLDIRTLLSNETLENIKQAHAQKK